MVWCNKSETVSEGKTHSPYHPAAVTKLISAIYVTNKMSKLPFGSPPFQMNMRKDIGQLCRREPDKSGDAGVISNFL